MSVKPIPDGYSSVTPYLIVKDASAAIEFYSKAFDAVELYRMAGPGGKVMHAEVIIGNSRVMMADEFPQMCAQSPETIGGSPVSIHLYVEDVDALYERAVAAGAKVRRPLKDQFYGDRSAVLEDPSGHVWNIATHTEDVAPEEMSRRFQAMMAQHSAA